MQYEEFKAQMTAFIARKANVAPEAMTSETKLVASGIVDSLLLTEVILFVEDTLSCNVDIENFKVASFETITSIYENYGR